VMHVHDEAGRRVSAIGDMGETPRGFLMSKWV
jgi:hypothetical protein